MNSRQLFLQHVAQTSPAPIGLEITEARGCYMWGPDNRKYLDLISGFSVMNLGHGQPVVIDAIKKQVDSYMHLMVYGELIETPQVQYAKMLTQYLPKSLNCVYFTNSGTEATEGAMKLAKRVTGRTRIISCNNSYHGSSQGALSIMGGEYFKQAFRPLLPDIKHVSFNSDEALNAINDETACIILETVQAEAGVRLPDEAWIKALRQKCTETGTLLILDEIQVGFGRTGPLWAFEAYDIVPDILILGKALGGGLPLGAFIADYHLMNQLTYNPVLGHISTFAGHPVSCAAGLASFQLLVNGIDSLNSSDNNISAGIEKWHVKEKAEKIKLKLLTSHAIKDVRNAGLLMAVEFENDEIAQTIIHACVKAGLITDWFLFCGNSMRVAPPLTISDDDIDYLCRIITDTAEGIVHQITGK